MWEVAACTGQRFIKEIGLATRQVEDVFADILDRAKALDPVNTRKWFEELTALRLEGGSLQIGCPNEATVQFLRDNCKKSFCQSIFVTE